MSDTAMTDLTSEEYRRLADLCELLEPTDREVDDDLKALGFHADEKYPEHPHASLRVAYREGWDSACAAIIRRVREEKS